MGSSSPGIGVNIKKDVKPTNHLEILLKEPCTSMDEAKLVLGSHLGMRETSKFGQFEVQVLDLVIPRDLFGMVK